MSLFRSKLLTSDSLKTGPAPPVKDLGFDGQLRSLVGFLVFNRKLLVLWERIGVLFGMVVSGRRNHSRLKLLQRRQTDEGYMVKLFQTFQGRVLYWSVVCNVGCRQVSGRQVPFLVEEFEGGFSKDTFVDIALLLPITAQSSSTLALDLYACSGSRISIVGVVLGESSEDPTRSLNPSGEVVSSQRYNYGPVCEGYETRARIFDQRAGWGFYQGGEELSGQGRQQ